MFFLSASDAYNLVFWSVVSLPAVAAPDWLLDGPFDVLVNDKILIKDVLSIYFAYQKGVSLRLMVAIWVHVFFIALAIFVTKWNKFVFEKTKLIKLTHVRSVGIEMAMIDYLLTFRILRSAYTFSSTRNENSLVL